MTTNDTYFQPFLTTEEVLSYLRITPRTIYRLIRSGELPALRIGRQWRFCRTDLDAWLERQQRFDARPAERPRGFAINRALSGSRAAAV